MKTARLSRSLKTIRVSKMALMNTTNMTGFLICTRGSSLAKESRTARLTSLGSIRESFGFFVSHRHAS